jgi:hypothetical protein
MQLVEVNARDHVVVLTAREIAAMEEPFVMVYFQLAGHSEFRQAGLHGYPDQALLRAAVPPGLRREPAGVARPDRRLDGTDPAGRTHLSAILDAVPPAPSVPPAPLLGR